jgi:hypothetical protein
LIPIVLIMLTSGEEYKSSSLGDFYHSSVTYSLDVKSSLKVLPDAVICCCNFPASNDAQKDVLSAGNA